MYGMNIAAAESARRSKAEWVKTTKHYTCGETGHLLGHCKKPKICKNSNESESKDENDTEKVKDSSSENEKEKVERIEKPKGQREGRHCSCFWR